jgi:hypothetical protein
MAALSWEYHRGNHIVIPVSLFEPPSDGEDFGESDIVYVIVDTGTNVGLVLFDAVYNRFAWAQTKQATMRGAGSGPIHVGWGMAGISSSPAATARQIPICDGGNRLRQLYDNSGAKTGFDSGHVVGQAGMAFLDSFKEWSSSESDDDRVFSIEL